MNGLFQINIKNKYRRKVTKQPLPQDKPYGRPALNVVA
jgi:hypothetical protein